MVSAFAMKDLICAIRAKRCGSRLGGGVALYNIYQI